MTFIFFPPKLTEFFFKRYRGAAVIGIRYLISLFSLLDFMEFAFVAIVLCKETTETVFGCVVNVYCGVVTIL